ncbi:MAG: ATP-binding cassette domain-containing protein [Solirubrobacteraceae bacterium]
MAAVTSPSPVAGPRPGPAEEPAIAMRALTKSYGRHPALEGLDLDVRRGEVFGFIGPNGAGKSTTIRLLLDLIRPTSGSVRVVGGDPRRDGVALRRRIGYLPGELRLYEDRTAAEHIALITALRGVPAPDADEVCERLGVELHRPAGTLSKGNRQKVGLALALMHRPELLVLDEPTTGLDPVVQREVHELLGEARDRGQTVFLSSHVLGEVERVADRVGLIRRGRLAVVDDVGRLKARTTRRVELHFDRPPPPEAFRGLAGVRDARFDGDRATFTLDGPVDALLKAAARFEVLTISSHEPDLEDVFLDLVEGEEAR